MYQEFDLPYRLYLDDLGRVRAQGLAVIAIDADGRRVTIIASPRIRRKGQSMGLPRGNQVRVFIDPGDPPVGVHRV